MYPFPHLPPRLSSTVFAELRASLPPPLDDTPEGLDSRDMMAMAAVAALGPVDITEALLAAQAVAAEAHARDAMRLTNTHRTDTQVVLRCRAQAASMIRTMHRSLAVLHRMQGMRPVEVAVPLAAPAADPRPADTPPRDTPPRDAPPRDTQPRDTPPRGAVSPGTDARTTGGDSAPTEVVRPAPADLVRRKPTPAHAARKPNGRASASNPSRAAQPKPHTAAQDGDTPDGWTGWREWPVTGATSRTPVPLDPLPSAPVPLVATGSDGRAA